MSKKNKKKLLAATITETPKVPGLKELRSTNWLEWERIFNTLLNYPMAMSCDSPMEHLESCMTAADTYILTVFRTFSNVEQPTFSWANNTEEVTSNE